MKRLLLIVIFLIGKSVVSPEVWASPKSFPVAMPAAYIQVAKDYGIPPDVFFSVMLQESRNRIKANNQQAWVPWPWTLNVELKPYYFANKEQAKMALRQFLAMDNKRIAVGIGQIYLPSHGHLFADPTQLLEPEINLQYAAKLLAENFQWTLMQGKPNWWVAVGRYHTPSRQDLAMAYRQDVYRRCQQISPLCDRYGTLQRGDS